MARTKKISFVEESDSDVIQAPPEPMRKRVGTRSTAESGSTEVAGHRLRSTTTPNSQMKLKLINASKNNK
tara:strand:+ start:253 stop:462 length:210 start_codon:yes stop_codon:yes gene_type:complete